MSKSGMEAEFQFWALTVPKNSTKKLEMGNDKSVYHISNATLGNKVSGGRTTVYFNANGKKAPICNLMDKTLENANLDLIVSRSMNASFTTQGPNAVTVSGYIQPLADESDNDIPTLLDLPLTNGADGAFESKESDAKVVEKAFEAKSVEASEMKVLESTEEDMKSEVPAASEEQKESKKRKHEEAESTDVAKAPEKKKNKKKRKKKKNQKTKEEASVNQTKDEGENKEVDQPAKQSSADEKNTEKVVNDTETTKDEREKEPKRVVDTPPKETTAKDSKPKSKSSKKSKKMVNAGKGVTYRVLKKGKSGVNPAKKGDSITLLYVGCLKDGKQFDKNLKDGLTFKIGGDEVIPGMELGVLGMCPKEKRRIIIPAEQGYGEDGASEGLIPPNAELHFTVQRK